MKNRKYHGINTINPDHFDLTQIKFYLYLLPMAIFTGLPIVFITLNAFKPLDELFAYPPKFYVKNPTIENFENLFVLSGETAIPASRYLFNSIFSTILVMLLTLTITTFAAYTLSKKKFKAKKLIFKINTVALMFVPIAVQMPRYLIIVKSGIYDTFLAHVIPLLAMPVGMFLVKQFVDGIPDSLIEAAEIDGASDYTIIFKIIVPMIAPALATVAILSFQSSWNSTEASQLFIDNESLKNFAFYMSSLTSVAGNTVAGAGMMAASSLIMFAPNLILFVILQSRVMNTMAHSGIK